MKQFVKQWWTTRCGRFMRLFAKADEGSGTVSGITLIAATAVMLGVVAAAGRNMLPIWPQWLRRRRCMKGRQCRVRWLHERRAVMAPSCNPAKSSAKMHESQSQWVRTCRLRLR